MLILSKYQFESWRKRSIHIFWHFIIISPKFAIIVYIFRCLFFKYLSSKILLNRSTFHQLHLCHNGRQFMHAPSEFTRQQNSSLNLNIQEFSPSWSIFKWLSDACRFRERTQWSNLAEKWWTVRGTHLCHSLYFYIQRVWEQFNCRVVIP